MKRMVRWLAGGRYRVMRLAKELGPDATLIEWVGKLTADCPKRKAGNIHDMCGARCPDMVRLFGRSRSRPLGL